MRRHTIPVDGDELVAVHHEAPTDDWLVFSHGFLSDKSGSYEGRCERAVTEGYNAVRFDHRGCGESDLDFGETTLSTRIADLRAVLSYFDPPSAVLFGSSFGGKVAFHTATETPVEAVATRAPVTANEALDSYRPSAGGGVGAAFFEDLDSYDFSAVTTALDVPVAIFHGREDEAVPLSDSLDAVAEFDTDVLLQQYADEGHNFSYATEDRLRDQLFDWLAALA